MTVKELIRELQKYKNNIPVYTENDEDILSTNIVLEYDKQEKILVLSTHGQFYDELHVDD